MFFAVDSADPKNIKWVVEYTRQPDDDEGVHTLYGTFESASDAMDFGCQEFGTASNTWRLVSIWPVREM